MDAARNPFVPAPGIPPPVLAGREDILRAAQSVLSPGRDARRSKGSVLVGLRGTGKTVLLTRIHELARAAGHIAVLTAADEKENLFERIAPGLLKALLALEHLGDDDGCVRRALGILRSCTARHASRHTNLALQMFMPAEAEYEADGDLETDLAGFLIATAEAARSKRVRIVLLIDDAHLLVRAEAAALFGTVREFDELRLPMAIVAAGLPQLLFLAARPASRSEVPIECFTIGPLSEDDACHAIEGPANELGVTFEDDAHREIYRLTKGLPYFLQEWGYRTWDLAKRSPITRASVRAATPMALRDLDAGFFSADFDRLTRRQKAYLRAMAELGTEPCRSSDIAELMGTSVESLAPLRNRLIHKGVVYGPAYGDTAFTTPMVADFLKRVMPAFDVG